MKWTKIKKLIAALSLLFPLIGTAQYDTIFHADKVNLLTVSIDYQNYTFTSAAINYYDCETCDPNVFQYEKDFEGSGDFGTMTFKFLPTQDTFFTGGIVWLGTGSIQYPTMISSTNPPFDDLQFSLAIPENITYLDNMGNPMQANVRTHQAWGAVSGLRIVQMMNQEQYQIICYLYTPSGDNDPGTAKWIFFFYKNMQTASVHSNEEFNISLYPNPVNDKLHFQFKGNAPTHYRILNLQGNIIESNEAFPNCSVDVNRLASGSYFIQFITDENEFIQLKWVKL